MANSVYHEYYSKGVPLGIHTIFHIAAAVHEGGNGEIYRLDWRGEAKGNS